jgi:catalase
MEYVKDQFRHCKAILALGAARKLLEMAGVDVALGDDAGLIVADSGKSAEAGFRFVAAIAAHRHPSRDSDPPRV